MQKIEEIREPIITATIFVPGPPRQRHHPLQPGSAATRWTCTTTGARCKLVHEMPMAEVVMDFFDKLKSCSRGYASLDYDFKGIPGADVVKLDIPINGERSMPCRSSCTGPTPSTGAANWRARCAIDSPRQMYDVAIQAAIGSHHRRENVKAMRKDVLAKCYGGDITRKKSC